MWAFLHPIFLAGLAAAAIPLLLHLLQKRRRTPIPFSAVRFLQQAQKRSARRLRLENAGLWLLRTALLALLALAFAQPVLRTASFGGWLGAAQRDQVDAQMEPLLVAVGFDDVVQAVAMARRPPNVDAHVTAWVDHDGLPLVSNEIGVVGESSGFNPLQKHVLAPPCG